MNELWRALAVVVFEGLALAAVLLIAVWLGSKLRWKR